MREKKKKSKKKLWIISTVILVLSLSCLAYALAMKISDKRASLFGYTFHIVPTDSMTPTIKPGDFVIAKKISPAKVEVGDIIIFKNPEPNSKYKTIIHRVVEIHDNGGVLEFTTKGDKKAPNEAPDPYRATDIIGVYRGRSAAIGAVLSFFQNWRNLAFLAAVLVCLYFAVFFFKRIITYSKNQGGDEPPAGDDSMQ